MKKEDEKMRVCDVVLNSVWYDPRVRKQIIEYKNNGMEVMVVGLKCARYDVDKVKLIPCETTIVSIDPQYDGQQHGVFRKLKRELLRITGVKDAIVRYQPNIIHANDLNALIPAYLASRKLGCKLVYDSHEINVENYTTDGRSPIAGIMKLVERFIVKRVDLMVCVSHAAADYFASVYKIKTPMVVTNCALRKELIKGTVQKHSGFEVINHGVFYPGRGYEEMVEVAERVKGFSDIHVCVRGFGRLEKSMRTRAEQLKVDNFIFYPPVNVEQLIPEAACSHVGVAITKPICLNFKLSVSNKLFEYAAAGLPVIMSDIPEHRYLNDQYNFGLILPDDSPKSLADAIIQLHENPELYQKLAENAMRLSEKVNWENEFAKLIDSEKAMLEGNTLNV